ncbi:nucleotide-binding oligomerization domain-containing protein 2 [Striga asiatica]|uniref:Nucleotide-binding oligomerization domain-containing protein 2 n=1 Tax=Striga asiatica TaxID=4170 RepID=A0A5A7PXC1_STRAF|nr:nucleotide-binding oligomerization domain-containing protein 2 [Striga asiatica]
MEPLVDLGEGEVEEEVDPVSSSRERGSLTWRGYKLGLRKNVNEENNRRRTKRLIFNRPDHGAHACLLVAAASVPPDRHVHGVLPSRPEIDRRRRRPLLLRRLPNRRKGDLQFAAFRYQHPIDRRRRRRLLLDLAGAAAGEILPLIFVVSPQLPQIAGVLDG